MTTSEPKKGSKDLIENATAFSRMYGLTEHTMCLVENGCDVRIDITKQQTPEDSE